MPGPVIQPAKLPWWLDPKHKSVMDPLYIALARNAASLIGLDDPAGQMMQIGSPTPLISMFKDKAERELGTALFRRLASEESVPTPIAIALNQFADKYPRVAAHMEPQIMTQDIQHKLLTYPPHAQTVYPPHGFIDDKVIGPAKIEIFPAGVKNILGSDKDIEAASNVVHHEGTHVAQMLGNRDMGSLYNRSHRLYGYRDNPFEVTARRSELRSSPSWNDAYNAATRSLKSKGISLDMLGNPEGNPIISLRKWGASTAPENYINPNTLNRIDSQLIQDVEEGHRNFNPSKGYVGGRRGTYGGTAIDQLREKVGLAEPWKEAGSSPGLLHVKNKLKELLISRKLAGWTPDPNYIIPIDPTKIKP